MHQQNIPIRSRKICHCASKFYTRVIMRQWQHQNAASVADRQAVKFWDFWQNCISLRTSTWLSEVEIQGFWIAFDPNNRWKGVLIVLVTWVARQRWRVNQEHLIWAYYMHTNTCIYIMHYKPRINECALSSFEQRCWEFQSLCSTALKLHHWECSILLQQQLWLQQARLQRPGQQLIFQL